MADIAEFASAKSVTLSNVSIFCVFIVSTYSSFGLMSIDMVDSSRYYQTTTETTVNNKN